MLTVLFCSALALAAGIAAAITFNTPRPPPRMASMENVFDRVDFSDMPEKHVFTARDGERLAFRAYPGDPLNITVLVHGSSGTSAGMHAVARTIHAKGQTVYALAMRGHDGTGRSGDIDYVASLRTTSSTSCGRWVRARQVNENAVGFFVRRRFRFAVCRMPQREPVRPVHPRFAAIAPQRAHIAAQSGRLRVSIALPRFICLLALSQLGINAFGGLRLFLALAVPPERHDVQTPFYSFRMQRNFGPSDDFLRDLKRAPGPVSLLVGSNDEIFQTEAYVPLLAPVRSDLKVTVVAGLGHMDMTVKPLALDALAAQF